MKTIIKELEQKRMTVNIENRNKEKAKKKAKIRKPNKSER